MAEHSDPSKRWGLVRSLFDAICDLPPDEQIRCLGPLSDDPAIREEVMALIRAQTQAFETALQPLREMSARQDDEELEVGDRIGHWTLTERLGRGGMGSVFIAERDDGLFRQRVALKILRHSTDVEAAALLEAERAVLAGLVHPGIARLYDGGTTAAGRPFLVMEYVDGIPLDAWMRSNAPTLAERLVLFDRLCEAVAYAHRQLVVHCDLKPANVLVRADGQPVLLDFGIARWVGADAEGVARGYCTPAYASPEQLAGQKPGVGTDVFALGVLLAELLADAPMARSRDDSNRPTSPPSRFATGTATAWRRQLEGDLDAIIAKATALDPRQRYPDVAALCDDLARHRDHLPISARRSGLPRRTVLFLRRYRISAMVATLAMLVVAGFTLQLVRERDRARESAAVAEQVSRFMVGAFDAANVRRDDGQRDLRARDVLRIGAQRVKQDLDGQPGVQARLLLAIGSAYASIGEPGEAMSMLARAVELAAPRERDVDVAIDALEEKSVIAGNTGNGADALGYALRAATLRERSGDDSIEGRAESLNHLGLALRGVRRFDDARQALHESLRLRRSLGAKAEQEVISTLNNLALVEWLDHRPAAAVPIYREAIALARALGPTAEPSLQNALKGLGQAYSRKRMHEEALPPLEESHALALRLYGEHNQLTTSTQAELALVLWDTGNLAAAEPLLRHNLEITKATLGVDSMPVAVAMNNLGLLLEERGDPEAALPLVAGSLAIRRRHLEADDPALRRATFNVARIELARGRIAEARALTAGYLEDLLAHPESQRQEWWSQVLLGLELAWRDGEAPAGVIETLSAFSLPAGNPALQAIGWRLPRLQARLLAADGRHAVAQVAVERALAAARTGGSRLDVATTALAAAHVAAKTGDREAALRHLDEARPVLDAVLVDGAPLRREAAALAAHR